MTQDLLQTQPMASRNGDSQAVGKGSPAVRDWFNFLGQLHDRQDATEQRLTRLETQLQSIVMTMQTKETFPAARSYRSLHAKPTREYSAPVKLSFLSLKWMFFFVSGLSLVLIFSAGFGAASPAIATWMGLMKTLLTPLAVLVLIGWFITVVQESFK
ncbi:MAG: hypothetical protein B0A82_18265 [Alkalinema sp. CACIAM 70d]|nr:MAG: hypothetical protein B0A82_18265 [Alkalinema sp. CACIAM 70d]